MLHVSFNPGSCLIQELRESERLAFHKLTEPPSLHGRYIHVQVHTCVNNQYT